MTLAQSSFRNRRGLPPGITAEVAAFAMPVTVTVPRETPDPYLNQRLREEAIGGEVMRALVDTMPANEAARARNIAALKVELAKPFERRFPHEGRSDRVYAENRR